VEPQRIPPAVPPGGGLSPDGSKAGDAQSRAADGACERYLLANPLIVARSGGLPHPHDIEPPHGRRVAAPAITLAHVRKDNGVRVVIYENACEQSSYVCELVHYAREPQLRVVLPPRARQQRDGAQLDGDDARRHGGERQLSGDAPAPDASVLVPSWSSSLLVTERIQPKSRVSFSGSIDVSQKHLYAPCDKNGAGGISGPR
jgi:hypothetical protein